MNAQRVPPTVRRRHVWTIVFRAEIPESIAADFAKTGVAELGQRWLDEVEIVGPLCYHCECEIREAPWSCSG